VLDDVDFSVVSVSQNTADILKLAARAIIGRPIDKLLVSETGIGLKAAFQVRRVGDPSPLSAIGRCG
jgi:light-regulated signal transduction histidine kinase (bacteriophytochrome)